MTCCNNCFAVLFAAIIWIELVKFWAYLIFLIDVVFSSWLLFYSVKETMTFLKETGNKSVTLNWICGMCTVVTIAIFGAIYFFTPLGHPAKEIVWGSFAVYGLGVFFLWLVVTFYMIYLRLGCAQGNSNDRPRQTPKRTNRPEGATLEQSLTNIVDNVENNPGQKGYTMYAVGSETPFQVRM